MEDGRLDLHSDVQLSGRESNTSSTRYIRTNLVKVLKQRSSMVVVHLMERVNGGNTGILVGEACIAALEYVD